MVPMRLAALATLAVALATGAARAQAIIVGNDDQARVIDGELTIDPEGAQTVSIIDLAGGPAVKATLAAGNSIFGPPTNLAITPDGKLALVAEALTLNDSGDGFVPSDIVRVIDLEADPPKVIDRVTVGKQPSGMSIHPSGTMALVANRAETSLSVLAIRGKSVTFEGKIDTEDQVTHVVFTPDGKRALANKATSDKVTLLEVDGLSVTYTGFNLPVGDFPYNSDITPDGKLALVANTGNNGRSDGNVDTVTVIDLEAEPPRVIDHLVVADAPEGIAVSPTGRVAVTGNLAGSDASPGAFFYNERGSISVLAIDGKTVRLVEEIRVGGISESLAFSPDGGLLLVGNLTDKTVSVLEVSGARVVDTGRPLALPGHPGSMRGRAR